MEAGEVVFAPFIQTDGGKKVRPGLVVETWVNGMGQAMVRLAYGTSKVERHSATDFVIGPEDGPAFRSAGLRVATKFRFDQFVSAPESACKRVGALNEQALRKAFVAFENARKEGCV